MLGGADLTFPGMLVRRNVRMVIWVLSFLGLSTVMTEGMDQNKFPDNRTAWSLPCPPNEYFHNGRCCMHCPAGTYVSAHCTVNHGPGSCSPCTPGKEFAAGPHGLEWCLLCHPCRFDDQVQVAGCTATEDYQCQCKPNTFCTNNCHLFCKDCTRCPEGQYEKDECTPTSDTVCENIGSRHPTTKGDPDDSSAKTLDGNSQALSVALPASICIAAIIVCVVLLIYWKRKQKDKDKLAGSRNEGYQRPPFEDSLETGIIVPVIGQPAQEQVDNLGAQEVCIPLGQQDKEDFIQVRKSNQCGVKDSGCEEEVPLTTDPTDNQEPSLGACSCVRDRIKLKNDKILTDEEWLNCYNCLIEHVTPNRWKEMMRHLGLREGDIQLTLLDHTNFREASYQMFLLWRNQNGQSASMSMVFHVLDKMDLRGCKENVANNLICNGIPVA